MNKKLDSPYRVSGARVRRRVRMVAVADNPLEIVNKVTGEVSIASPYVGSRAWRDIASFIKVFDTDKISDLQRGEYSVFFWMLGKLDFDGGVLLDVDECARSRGISKRMVYYSVRGLVDKDFIRKDKRGMYWVNPNIAFRGNRDELLEL